MTLRSVWETLHCSFELVLVNYYLSETIFCVFSLCFCRMFALWCHFLWTFAFQLNRWIWLFSPEINAFDSSCLLFKSLRWQHSSGVVDLVYNSFSSVFSSCLTLSVEPAVRELGPDSVSGRWFGQFQVSFQSCHFLNLNSLWASSVVLISWFYKATPKGMTRRLV